MYKKILVANDGSEGAFKALSAAFNIALRYVAELHMITVEDLPRFPGLIDEVEAEIEADDRRFAPVIARSKTLASMQNLTLHCHIVPSHSVPTIIEFARERASTAQIASSYGTSDQLCEWRLRMTGVDLQLRRRTPLR